MNSKPAVFPQEYRLPVVQDHIRSLKPPHLENLTVIHAFVKLRDIPNGRIPDKINPRSHEEIKMNGRVPQAIEETMQTNSKIFHLLNRGCLILAKNAWYDNQSKILHFIVESEEEHGMVDGATTDRTLEQLKRRISSADFSSLKEEEIPEEFKESYIHLEIIAGNIDSDLRLLLARARNTSEQVKEFSLEDLGGGYDWLKDILEKSELRGRIKYRENEPKPVDIRTVLALLIMFHPNWSKENKETKGGRDPMIAYTNKGVIIDLYKDKEWKKEFEKLAPVAVDILKLYDYIHVHFQEQYMKGHGGNSKLGKRVEVKYISDSNNAKVLPLTESKTQYVIPDGWLYPLLASLRMLLDWPSNGRGDVKWRIDPFKYFNEHGAEMVSDIIAQSEELGRNPGALGKSKRLWSGLRMSVKMTMDEKTN